MTPVVELEGVRLTHFLGGPAKLRMIDSKAVEDRGEPLGRTRLGKGCPAGMRAHFKCSRRERLSLFRGCLHLVRVAVALETLGIGGSGHRAIALMFLVAGRAGASVHDIGLVTRMTRLT